MQLAIQIADYLLLHQSKKPHDGCRHEQAQQLRKAFSLVGICCCYVRGGGKQLLI